MCEKMPQPVVVDLFSGAGGLSAGFQEAGFHIAGGMDNWAPASDSFKANHPGAFTITGNIRSLEVSAISELLSSPPDVLLGGPSCQGFSTAGGFSRAGRNESDERNSLFLEFIRFVEGLEPRWVVMENVPGLLLYRKGVVAKEVIKQFRLVGYHVVPLILLAADYGVPQLRRRLFFVGSRSASHVPIPVPQFGNPDLWSKFALPFEHLSRIGNKTSAREVARHISFEEACGDLPPLAPGSAWEGDHYPRPSRTPYQSWAREGSQALTLHHAFPLSDFDAKAIPHIGVGENWTALPPALKTGRFGKIRPYDATTLLRRLDPTRPAYTITTKFNEGTTGAFIHPKENRTLSVREAARLQGFRDAFRFKGSKNEVRRLIGNAVPPLLAQEIALELRRAIDRTTSAQHADERVVWLDPTLSPERLIGLKESREDANQLQLI